MINIVCRRDKEISSIKMFKCLSPTQLFEFRKVAMQVVVHCSNLMANSNNILTFEILINALINADIKMQKILYECLESRSINMAIDIGMVK